MTCLHDEQHDIGCGQRVGNCAIQRLVERVAMSCLKAWGVDVHILRIIARLYTGDAVARSLRFA